MNPNDHRGGGEGASWSLLMKPALGLKNSTRKRNPDKKMIATRNNNSKLVA